MDQACDQETCCVKVVTESSVVVKKRVIGNRVTNRLWRLNYKSVAISAGPS